MTASRSLIAHALRHGDTPFFLNALHWHGYSVTIHSPKTSSNGLYLVSAYQHVGKRLVTLRGSNEHLHDAIKAVAEQLGRTRLRAYAHRVLDEPAEAAS
ncbi:hypothetical protein [Nonomuraea sp. NPDC049400]|uniref:hypothetical protein n=1 Tax=Nonomuraea sp. NPDC049400 TaxID=3364352 RepID=UPI0037AAF04B